MIYNDTRCYLFQLEDKNFHTSIKYIGEKNIQQKKLLSKCRKNKLQNQNADGNERYRWRDIILPMTAMGLYN